MIPRLHTPTFGNPDLPEGYAACLDCGEVMTVDQLLEECAAPEFVGG